MCVCLVAEHLRYHLGQVELQLNLKVFQDSANFLQRERAGWAAIRIVFVFGGVLGQFSLHQKTLPVFDTEDILFSTPAELRCIQH